MTDLVASAPRHGAPTIPRRHFPARLWCALLLVVTLVTANASPSCADDHPELVLELVLPVDARVSDTFRPPSSRWGAGHRGVDLEAEAGTEVRAAAAGTVSFAGSIAGRTVLSITHDAGRRLRTTYEPIEPAVRPGQVVAQGQVIGHVQAVLDHHDGLHWGLLEGDTYLDPLHYLAAASARPIRLLPLGHQPQPTPRSVAVAPGNPGESVRPSEGPITSPFGMRFHPIRRVFKLHDGVDVGAPCGSAVRSIAAGTVVKVDRHAAYGWRVWVEHPDGRRTGYTHLQAFHVSLGDRVAAGQQLGEVGNTGLSTGCHLHFMGWLHGELVDPTRWLG